MQCPRCAGSGNCVECQGRGTIECPACNGKGQGTTSKGITFECRHCKGSGGIDCSTKCSSCDGSGVITDQLRREVRDKYVMKLENTAPLNRITNILIAINVTMFLVQQWGSPQASEFISRYLFNTIDGLGSGEIWRLVTPMFLHGNLIHVFLNCYFMWQCCPVLEGLYGSKRYLLLYLIGGVVGNLFSWLGNCQLDHHFYAGIGASTSLFAVSAAIIALHLRFHFFQRQTVQQFALYSVVLLVLGFAGVINFIDNWGHLGGVVAGLAYVYLSPRPSGR